MPRGSRLLSETQRCIGGERGRPVNPFPTFSGKRLNCLSGLQAQSFTCEKPRLVEVFCVKTTEYFGWEGTFEGQLVQAACDEQEHLHNDKQRVIMSWIFQNQAGCSSPASSNSAVTGLTRWQQIKSNSLGNKIKKYGRV